MTEAQPSLEAATTASNAEPTDAEPTDAEPTDAEPTDAEPTDAEQHELAQHATDGTPACTSDPRDSPEQRAVSDEEYRTGRWVALGLTAMLVGSIGGLLAEMLFS